MANIQGQSADPSAPNLNDLPPPYSAVVGNPQYGFVTPPNEPYMPSGAYPHPKQYRAPVTTVPQPGEASPTGVSVPVNLVLPLVVGSEPTTITCFNCGKVGTSRVTYTTAWHTHLFAGSICVITMVCSLCCLGLLPYCFDTFKDSEHYCPYCNTFLAKSIKC